MFATSKILNSSLIFVRPSEILNSSFKGFKIFEAKQNSEKLWELELLQFRFWNAQTCFEFRIQELRATFKLLQNSEFGIVKFRI